MRAARGAKGAGPQVEVSTDAAEPCDASDTNPEPTHSEEALEQEQASEQEHADDVVRALARRVLCFCFYPPPLYARGRRRALVMCAMAAAPCLEVCTSSVCSRLNKGVHDRSAVEGSMAREKIERMSLRRSSSPA